MSRHTARREAGYLAVRLSALFNIIIEAHDVSPIEILEK